MKSIGIDIGSSSIKVVEAVAGSRGAQVLSFREFPIGNNPSIDTELETIEILRRLQQEYSGVRCRFVMGLKQDYVSARFKTFPFSDRLKILKSLPFELEDDFPFSNDSAIFEARMGRYVGPTSEVLAVAAPKVRIAHVLDQIKDSGIELHLLTVEGLALANCFQTWWEAPASVPSPTPEMEEHPEPRRLKAVVSIGHSHSVVVGMDGDQVVGLRSILWGSRSVADSIAARYEIAQIEAMKEMKTKAFVLTNKAEATYEQVVFSDTIAAQVADLGKEIRISLLELQTHIGGEFDSVEITGGFSQTVNLNAYLTTLLELPVNRATCLALQQTSLDAKPSTDAVIGIALGLAIEGLRKPRNPAVQLIRGDFLKQGDTFKELWATWAPTAKFLAALWVGFFIYSWLREDASLKLLEETNEVLKKQARVVAGLGPRQANEGGVKAYIRNQRKEIQEMKEMLGVLGMNQALDLLQKVSQSVPARGTVDLQVRNFKVNDGAVLMEGVLGQSAQRPRLESSLKSLATSPLRLAVGSPAAGQNQVSFRAEWDMNREIKK